MLFLTELKINYNQGYRTGIDEGYQTGMSVGMDKGVGIGEETGAKVIREVLVKYVQKVYHEDIISLIKDLSLEDLSYVQDKIFDLNNIEEIKELIKKIG